MKVCCSTCHKILHSIKHFTTEDGRILCYKCRIKEKAKPANKSFVSALGIKKEE
jgi:hypothetical protein